MFEHAIDHDGEDDIFLELYDLKDPAIFVESSKKRKFEEGEKLHLILITK